MINSGNSYTYNNHGADGGIFTVIANLSAIQSTLGTLTVDITHNGSFDNIAAYQSDQTGKYTLTGVQLNGISGNITIASIVKLDFNLQHSTPGFGTAQYFNAFISDDKSQTERKLQSRLWTSPMEADKYGWVYFQPPKDPSEWSQSVEP